MNVAFSKVHYIDNKILDGMKNPALFALQDLFNASSTLGHFIRIERLFIRT